MNYLIFDLEFNQHYSKIKEDRNVSSLNCPFEIIQIGAVKLDHNLNTISNFDFLVKPEIYTEIHPYVNEITGLTIEKLQDAKSFKEVYKNFCKFIDDNNYILCVWGMSDIKELYRNIRYHGLNTSIVPTEYINLQSHISKYLNCPKGTHVGLRNAIELLKLPIKDGFHNAFNDAFYTAEIFKKTYSENFKTSMYTAENHKQISRGLTQKYEVDLPGLFLQFEKMYNREMSIEEKNIIKLAYFMGKTNQFLL